MNGGASGRDEHRLREKEAQPPSGHDGVSRHNRREWKSHVSPGWVDDRRSKRENIEEDHQQRHADVEPAIDSPLSRRWGGHLCRRWLRNAHMFYVNLAANIPSGNVRGQIWST